MPTAIEIAILRATERFAHELLSIFRGAVLGDGVPEGRTARPTRTRPSGGGDASAAVLDAILTAKSGLSSEALQRTTGRSKAEVTTALRKLLSVGSVRKAGKARGTRYIAIARADIARVPTRAVGARRRRRSDTRRQRK